MAEFLNRFRTDLWKTDSWASVDFYNDWFMNNAPLAYKSARVGILKRVKKALQDFDYLRFISADIIIKNPAHIGILRSCTVPPLAIDRLAGLSHTNRNLICTLENGKLPLHKDPDLLKAELERICDIISKLLDNHIFPWLNDPCKTPSSNSSNRSASIVADRISGALADPIIRNSQEKRQFDNIRSYLTNKGYSYIAPKDVKSFEMMPAGSFSFHINCPVKIGDSKTVNMPIDVVVQTKENVNLGKLPILIECKSAGDFTNTNKRRKEEAIKAIQLRSTYGEGINFILFLCGYFDSTYLGYEASEGIDWVWEHRISDLEHFGI